MAKDSRSSHEVLVLCCAVLYFASSLDKQAREVTNKYFKGSFMDKVSLPNKQLFTQI